MCFSKMFTKYLQLKCKIGIPPPIQVLPAKIQPFFARRHQPFSEPSTYTDLGGEMCSFLNNNGNVLLEDLFRFLDLCPIFVFWPKASFSPLHLVG